MPFVNLSQRKPRELWGVISASLFRGRSSWSQNSWVPTCSSAQRLEAITSNILYLADKTSEDKGRKEHQAHKGKRSKSPLSDPSLRNQKLLQIALEKSSSRPSEGPLVPNSVHQDQVSQYLKNCPLPIPLAEGPQCQYPQYQQCPYTYLWLQHTQLQNLTQPQGTLWSLLYWTQCYF